MKGRIALIGGFLALSGWLVHGKPYSGYLEQAEPAQLVAYHAARVLFALFFALIAYGAGCFIHRKAERYLPLCEGLDNILLRLFAGLAALRVLGLALGFTFLLRWWLVALLASFALWHAWPRTGIRALLLPITTFIRIWQQQGTAEKTLHLVVALAALATIGCLFAGKLFFPLADPDYLDHYLNYYVRVVEDGHVWPMHAWHHFYDARGGSEIFLAVTLSDPTAPFAVNALMLGLCFAASYRLVQHASGSSLCAWAGCALAAAAFMPVVPGVAEFCKQHIIGGALLLGLVWMSQHCITAHTQQQQRAWVFLIAVQCFMIALFRPTFAAIACGFCVLMAVCHLIRRERLCVHAHAAGALAAVMGVACVLGFNQLITGLADATPYRLFYPFANQETVAKWFSPFWLIVWDLGSTLQHGSVALPDAARLTRIAQMLRLHEIMAFAPLGFAPLMVFILLTALRGAWLTPSALNRLLPVLMLLFAAGMAALFIRQDISLARAYIFCSFAIGVLGAVLFGWAACAFEHPLWKNSIHAMLVATAALVALQAIDSVPNRHKRDIAQLASGQLTLGQMYTRDYPNWPAYAAACRALPPHSRVWTSRYMPTPGCKAENFFYFTMGKDWHRVLFEPADIAKRALQEAGLNYFLIDTSEPFFDLLPYAPLFQPHSIPQSFRIVFRQGDVYVLGWKNDEDDAASHNVLAQEFIPAYANSVHLALRAADFPGIYGQMLHYYQLYRERGHGPVVLDPALPRPRGWQ